MENFVVLNGYAKVNLSLAITGVKDGFHMLDSVMAKVDMSDKVTMSIRNDKEVSVTYLTGETFCPDNAYNLAVALMERYDLPGVDIKISKAVPQGIGVGGSAVDGGAIARGYEMLTGKTFDNDFLVTLGGDVPVLKSKGASIVRGRGEKITPIELKETYVLLAYGKKSLNTREVFALYDKIGGDEGSSEQFLSDYIPFNALERSAITLEPEILKSKNLLLEAGFERVAMTGAGAGFIALESDKEMFSSKLSKAIALASDEDITLKPLTLIKD